MGDGLSVIPSVLQVGSQSMAILQEDCLDISAVVMGALNTMAASVSHPAVTSALKAATTPASQTYTGMWGAIGHASNGLSGAAGTYSGTDQNIASQIGAALSPGTFAAGPKP
jgi:hypothetical protein